MGSSLSDRKVILVADTEDQAYYHTVSQQFENCEVICKTNINEAKEYYVRNKVDIAILSNIPETPCLDLLKFLKTIKPLVNVIIMTRSGF